MPRSPPVPKCTTCPERPTLTETKTKDYLTWECPRCGFLASFKL